MTGSYRRRIERVMDHITANLAADHSLDSLADVAALSRFHFHRVFVAMQGETVAEAVRRLRMNHAAHLVVTTAQPMARVAARCGYPDPDSFTRQFRASFGLSPTQMRRGGQLPAMRLPARKGKLPMYDVTIEQVAPLRLAALDHHGAYTEIGATCARLMDLVTRAGLWPHVTGPMACTFLDDPSVVPVSQLRSSAGVMIGAATHPPEGQRLLDLPGGRAARLTVTGPYTQLAAAWAWLYGRWLPESGEDPADSPTYELYPNGPQDTPQDRLLTHVYLRLKPR